MDKQENEMMNDADQSRKSTQGLKKKIHKKIMKKLILPLLFIVLIVAAGILIKSRLFDGHKNKEEILTVATLEKIINISELSTFEAVYNGIAKVMNEKKSDQVDYYVSYEAKVYAGFDIDKVLIDANEDIKKITLTIPEINITDIDVDIASLDYIFLNDKANTSTVSEQAYKACIADVTNESENETAINDLAEQNAKNIMKALLSPFIEALDSDYELEIN